MRESRWFRLAPVALLLALSACSEKANYNPAQQSGDRRAGRCAGFKVADELVKGGDEGRGLGHVDRRDAGVSEDRRQGREVVLRWRRGRPPLERVRAPRVRGLVGRLPEGSGSRSPRPRISRPDGSRNTPGSPGRHSEISTRLSCSRRRAGVRYSLRHAQLQRATPAF